MEEEHCRPVLGPANDRLERQRRADTLFKLKLPPLLVMPDTPYFLNERLTAHQGAFLCTGNISKPFVENLKAMIGWDRGCNVRKLRLCFDPAERVKAVKTLKRMNVSSTVLFPGLDGFARSLGEELPHYHEVFVEDLGRTRQATEG